MPYRINGIGTGYYGQKNLKKTPGYCKKCCEQVELQSYQTRLWFSIFFIPVIPLQRRQIHHYCPSCTSHFAEPLGAWQERGEQLLAVTKSEWSAHPEQAESSIKLHSSLVSFQRQEEAIQMAREMKTRHYDDFTAQIYLGVYFEGEGLPQEADACFARALDLKPDDPGAQRAVAVGCLQRGDLSRARRLLSFMEAKGPHQEYALLAWLAHAFQQRGEQGSSLEIFHILCRDFPKEAAKDKKLRRAVRQAERTQGIQTSILPRAAVNRKLLIASGVAILILAGIWLVNRNSMRHQDLHLVNGFPVQARVAIAGIGEWLVQPEGRLEITVPEGTYQASVQVDGGPVDHFDISLRNGFFERFSDGKVFILNAGGGAVILWESTEYSEKPDINRPNPYRFHLNEKCLALSDVDYPFRPYPETLRLEKGSRVIKSRVDMIRGKPEDLIESMVKSKVPTEEIIRFAEAHLAANPADDALLNQYAANCLASRRTSRAVAFMRTFLEQRPVRIEWHRSYQTLMEEQDRKKDLRQEYDVLLQKEPDDSSLLYLRGRLCPDSQEAFRYFDRSIRADADNPFPWNAKSFNLTAQGQFAAARLSMAAACRLKPREQDYRNRFRQIRFALGEYEDLEKELRETLRAEPLDVNAGWLLMQTYVARGEPAACQRLKSEIFASYEAILQKEYPNPSEFQNVKKKYLLPFQKDMEMNLAYLLGDYPRYLEMAKIHDDENQVKLDSFCGLISQMNLAEADEALSGCRLPENQLHALLMWLGWRVVAGDDAKAAPWLAKSSDLFAEAQSSTFREIARLLNGRENDVLARIDDLGIDLPPRAILCAAFAEIYPRLRRDLLYRAEKLNFDLNFPHPFLKKAVQIMKARTS